MSWDDGSHAKVKKVQLTFDDIIYSIQVTYDGTALQSQRRGSAGPKSAEFTLDSDEYITALSAYGKTLSTQEVITALTFKTNKRTHGPFGNKSGFQISAPEATGKQIAGFLGTSGNVLNSIDVHYAPIPGTGSGGTGTGGTGTGGTGSGGTGTGGTGSGGTGSGSGPQKLDAQGGTGGTPWDDGSNYDGLKKIYVRFGGLGIQFVKFDYVKDGQTKEGAQHGVQSRGSTKEILINHPDEYLVSVEGWYDSTNVIQGIEFKTNKKTEGNIGNDYESGGTKFTLRVQDKKIIGFHGFAGNNLNSIGAYLAPIGTTALTPAEKVEGVGSDGGSLWDDGAFDDVKIVYVGQANDGIAAVKFEYVKGGQAVLGPERGKPTMLDFEAFKLDYPSEYIIAVEGTYDKIYGSNDTVINMLRIKTNKRTSPPYGLEAGTPFVLKKDGHKIVGFHGRVGDLLHKVGVHVVPLTK